MTEAEKDTYSPFLLFVYSFNLILGVGALSMPHGFQIAGVYFSTLVMLFIAFFAYIGVTFIIETMAAANALVEMCGEEDEEESTYLINTFDKDTEAVVEEEKNSTIQESDRLNEDGTPKTIFEITRRFELGTMAKMFCGKRWEMVFYVILIVYLFGDLAIYAVAVPASISELADQYFDGSSEGDSGWSGKLYYIFLTVFAICIVPFCFFNIQKTKYLQYCTITLRNVSMLTIIVLSIIRLASGKGANYDHLRKFKVGEFPSLFGTIVYGFMCHHSLPSFVTPVNDKKNIFFVMAMTYVFIVFVYLIMTYLTVFAYGDPCEICFNGQPCAIEDLITETFAEFSITTISVFLTLYPVFTLSTSYPLIAITLRNNLMNCISWGSNTPYAKFRPYVFAALASLPPFVIAFGTQNVYKLVDITGAYGGVGIQWFIPAVLAYYSRKKMKEVVPELPNPYASQFKHPAWLVCLVALTALSLIVSTYNIIIEAIKGDAEITCQSILQGTRDYFEL